MVRWRDRGEWSPDVNPSSGARKKVQTVPAVWQKIPKTGGNQSPCQTVLDQQSTEQGGGGAARKTGIRAKSGGFSKSQVPSGSPFVVFTTASEDFSTTILVQRINVSKNCVGIVECVKTEETRTYKSRRSLYNNIVYLSLSRSPHAGSLSLALTLTLK